ncbi:MAG: RIP metalloprotease RseP [Deltaproteobacteria bacterium]|nr:RIP metalloprotease RseP [Deltaproteobacteria bacterium]
MMIQLLGAVFLLGILIFIHELGHFLAMKAFGVKVLKFSLGFGKAIPGLRFRKGETEYQVAWVPLGGYVKALGEEPNEPVDAAERERSLRAIPRWKQAVIYAAGPLSNLVLPVVIFFFVYLAASERPGPYIGEVMMDSPAQAAGFEPGDRIVEISGRKIHYWSEVPAVIQELGANPLKFKVKRHGSIREIVVTPAKKSVEDNFGEKHQVFRVGFSVMFRPAVIGIDKPSSLAYKAGLRTGDRILKIDDKPVERFLQVKEMLTKAAGKNVRLTVSRRPFPRPVPRGRYGTSESGDAKVIEIVLPPAVEGSPARGLESGDLYIGRVDPDGLAAKAGLEPGDRIKSVQGRDVPAWDDFADLANQVAASGKPVDLVVIRRGSEVGIQLSLKAKQKEDELGRQVKVYQVGAYSLLHGERRPMVMVPNNERLLFAAGRSFRETWGFVDVTVRGLYKMITGKISTKSLGGPIMIFSVAARAAEAGLTPWLKVLGLISIGLGLLNLLIPIPLLDSGQILILLIEGARRRPMSLKTREAVNLVGLSLLIMLMGLAFWNDIRRFFFG